MDAITIGFIDPEVARVDNLILMPLVSAALSRPCDFGREVDTVQQHRHDDTQEEEDGNRAG